jgi:uncharacterized peroxidase-related enzyme
VLEAYLNFSQALSKASLSAGLREQISLAVAGASGCDYCASAHAAVGKKLGLDASELQMNLRGEAGDARTRAALDFARTMVEKRGWVDDADLAAVRDAGYGETEIVEIVATVALNLFSNYFNHVVGTEVDFPPVRSGGGET